MPTANAIRVQKHYERRQAGRFVLNIDVPEDPIVAMLIDEGLLDPMDGDNRCAIARAFELRLSGELYSKGYMR